MSKALQVGRKVLAGLANAHEARRENGRIQVEKNERIIFRAYLKLLMAGRPSYGISEIVRKTIAKEGITLSGRSIRKYLAAIPAASKTMQYGGSNNYGGLHHDTAHST